jgi:leukotriene-A4 hydrolase
MSFLSRAEAASDPTTQSNYFKIATQHVSVDWTIDWTNKVIFGSITHVLKAKEDEVNEVM